MEFMFLLVLMFISYSPLILIIMFVFYLFFLLVYLNFLMNSYFYSYLIFLLFISGLMVMFMYLCSVILNEKFSLSSSLSAYFFLYLIFSLDLNYLDSVNDLNFYSEIYEFLNMIKFIIFSYNWFSMFFILYLLFCLLIVYEIIKKTNGPLRSNI